ncbi:MAG: HINT domain-containing protein [Gemmataceae bacterium]|nr:HINT domain-containing protein [Gemmataceae bacterium]
MGDELAARHDADPSGEVGWKAVEACFRRTGRVLHLHFPGGEVVRTTPEHPFWVEGQGWTPAGELKEGDRIATLSGEWVPVGEVFDTGAWEPVYNVRVADYHTYFVGSEGWGWAAWAHNAYTQQYYIAEDAADFSKYTVYDSTNGTKVQAKSASADGAVSIGAFVSRASLKDAFAYLMKYKQEFEIKSRDQLYNFDQGSRSMTPDPINGRGSSRINNLWTKVIDVTDARSHTKPVAEVEYANFKATAPASFTDPYWQPPGETRQWTLRELTGTRVDWPSLHAHHIVAKNRGSLAAQSDWWNSERALRTVGLDPYFSVANLAWTPEWVKHGRSGQYRKSVWKSIDEALPNFKIDDNPTPQTVALHVAAGDDVKMKDALVDIANNFFVGKYVM